MTPIRILARRQLRMLRGSARTVTMAVAAPLLFAFIVGSVYSGRKLTALPVTIVDQDHSALSREISAALLATEPFVAGQYADSPAKFELLAAEGKSQVCFIFPARFERDVKSGHAGAVAVLVAADNLIAGNMAATAFAAVLGSYSVGVDVRKLRLRGTPEALAREIAMPVSMQTRTLFNPALNGNYANFLVMGFLAIAVQLSGLLAATRAAGNASALGLNRRDTRSAAAAQVAIIAVIVWAGAWATVRCSVAGFGLPMRGSEGLLALVIFWFVTNLAALGFGIACLAQDALFASEICAVITMPNFLVSGFTWPVLAMPQAMQVLAYALPMHPLVFALRKISLMGAGVRDLGFEFGLLAAWSVAAAATAILGASRMAGSAPEEATS
jgi:ABC-2 type transport system permease protein